MSPVTVIVTDGWATPSDPASVVQLADAARQQVPGLRVFVVAVGPTARWNVLNVDGMAGSTDRVSYVESVADVDVAVNKVLDMLCNHQ